ncbi:Hypothetical protein CINCED_3A021644 [Cinara cedri]|uniref:Tudor domain-containing protein 5 n=1 Tax=Cinara cedri TaxID=506608 RepID=A0A5E4MPZ6_9HEMI|nr:Hypothetical protein CINCED_3A021644 [Cinara cedri]
MAEPDLNYVKTVVRSIITSTPGDLTVADILNDYCILEGTHFPFLKLGFDTSFELLKSMDDILRLPHNPNLTSKIIPIADKKTSHLIELVEKQKNKNKRNYRRSGRKSKSYNSNGQNIKYNTMNFHSPKHGFEARGYDYIKYEQNNSQKTRGYVTNELKHFIEILCGSMNTISIPKLKVKLINHPDYSKLNTINIEEAINMLKTFIYIDKNGVHLKDSEYNIFNSHRKSKITNNISHKIEADEYGKPKQNATTYNSNDIQPRILYALSDQNSDTEDDDFGMSEGLDYCNTKKHLFEYSKKTNKLELDDMLSKIHLKTIIKSNEELCIANDTEDNCYQQSQSLNLCDVKETELNDMLSGIPLKPIIKPNKELSITDITVDNCYKQSQSSNFCDIKQTELSKNHQELKNANTSMAPKEYHKILEKTTNSNVEQKPKSNRQGIKTCDDLMMNNKARYKNMIISIIENSRFPIDVNNVMATFKKIHGYEFPLQIFGCRTYMDFFRLHPAVFKLENSYSSKSIVSIENLTLSERKTTLRHNFICASTIYDDDVCSDKKPEEKAVQELSILEEFKLNSNYSNQYKECNDNTQLSSTNTQTFSSSSSKTIFHTNLKDTKHYEMYDSAMILDSMKKKMRLILAKHKNGILCNEFMDIYDAEYNGCFTFSEYGFRSMRDMAFNLPSIFYVKESEENGEYVLYDARRRSEFENLIDKLDPSLYYKNIPKTVMYNLSMIFDKNRTGISLVELKHLYCTEFGRCYEPSKYGYYSEEHMFKLLNKMIQIKDNKLYTVDPFAYINFTDDYDCTTQSKKNCLPLVMDRVLFNYTGKDICNAKFDYSPFELTEENSVSIITAEIYNPNSFYIHLKSKLNTLENLMANLQEYYDKNELKYIVLPDLLIPGLACCLRFENTINWHRAKILTIIDKDYVKVAYVDFGSYEVVNKSRIRLLVSKFSIEPVLALHCCLYSDDEFNFSRETNEIFGEMVDGFDLEAHFHGFTFLKDGIKKMRLQLFLKVKDMESIDINKLCAKHIKNTSYKSETSIRRIMCEIEQEKSILKKINTPKNKNNSS